MYYRCMKIRKQDCKPHHEHRGIELEALFRRHYEQMYRLAVLLLHDDAESKDIVHDVFAQLLTSSKEQLREETAEAFLLTCIRNRCLNVMRGRRIQERVQRLYLLDLETLTLPPDLFREEQKTLLEGVRLLAPPVCKEIIELHFRDGLTFREIAIQKGVSETTIYKHLRNALCQLRTYLKKDEHDEQN